MTQEERLDKLILCADLISRRLGNLPLEIRASWDAFFIDSAVIDLRLIIKDIESELIRR